mgnify:FL=1
MPIASRAAICPLGVREGGRGRATEVSVNRRVFSADSARSVARTRAGGGLLGWGGVGAEDLESVSFRGGLRQTMT